MINYLLVESVNNCFEVVEMLSKLKDLVEDPVRSSDLVVDRSLFNSGNNIISCMCLYDGCDFWMEREREREKKREGERKRERGRERS